VGTWWGAVSSAHVQETVESSDLVLFAGTIFNDYTTVGWTAEISQSKSIVLYHDHVNICGKHFANVYMKDIITKLTPRAPVKDASLVTYHRYKDQDPVAPLAAISNLSLAEKDKPLTLKFISGQIQARLTPKTSLVIETGDSWFIGQSLKLPAECLYHIQMQYGSIGWSVGATLGVALAVQSTRRVLALIGDGSFQLTAQEVSTMIRQGIKATILLFNNDGYTIEVQIHDGPYNDIQMWKYAELINAFNANNSKNCLGIKVTTNQQLVDALNTAENFPGIVLIEMCIGRDDCTANLLIWGSKVAHSNGRAP
jgi:TPP-dependent 2-oxoacid decarboxylase